MDMQSGKDAMVSHPLSTVRGSYKKCAIDGCEGNAHHSAKGSRGWCGAHYQRWKKHGDPLAGGVRRGSLGQFLRDVAFGNIASDDCIIWPYARNQNGYGVTDFGGRKMLAHRAVCILAHGEAPGPRFQAAHICGNGHEGCVNPLHLRWATKAQNQADRRLHGTDNRGSRHGNSKLTEADVRNMRSLSGVKTKQEIADQFCVSRECVSAILAGKTWRHIIEGGDRRLEAGFTSMVSHNLSSIHGQYAIEIDGRVQFVTAEPEVLFEQLATVDIRDAHKVRILLVSSEEFASDDITVLVWDAMADHLGGENIQTVEEWEDRIGRPCGFIRFGFEEGFDPNAERARRKAAHDARRARFAKFRQPDPALAIAAE